MIPGSQMAAQPSKQGGAVPGDGLERRPGDVQRGGNPEFDVQGEHSVVSGRSGADAVLVGVAVGDDLRYFSH